MRNDLDEYRQSRPNEHDLLPLSTRQHDLACRQTIDLLFLYFQGNPNLRRGKDVADTDV